jgi:hypothetical protein
MKKTINIGTDHYDKPEDKKEEVKDFKCSFILFDPNVNNNELTKDVLLNLFQKPDFGDFKQNIVLQGYHPLVY